MINQFRGPYFFLSNFYPAPVVLDRVVYPTVEHAYQAAKSLNVNDRRYIQLASSPSIAKQRGNDRSMTLRLDWDQVKLQIMTDFIRQKFQNTTLSALLLATGNQHLTEGNTWGDTYWGTVDGVGQNHLGKILMQVRQELLDAKR